MTSSVSWQWPRYSVGFMITLPQIWPWPPSVGLPCRPLWLRPSASSVIDFRTVNNLSNVTDFGDFANLGNVTNSGNVVVKRSLTGNGVRYCYLQMASLLSNSKCLTLSNLFKSCALAGCIFGRVRYDFWWDLSTSDKLQKLSWISCVRLAQSPDWFFLLNPPERILMKEDHIFLWQVRVHACV